MLQPLPTRTRTDQDIVGLARSAHSRALFCGMVSFLPNLWPYIQAYCFMPTIRRGFTILQHWLHGGEQRSWSSTRTSEGRRGECSCIKQEINLTNLIKFPHVGVFRGGKLFCKRSGFCEYGSLKVRGIKTWNILILITELVIDRHGLWIVLFPIRMFSCRISSVSLICSQHLPFPGETTSLSRDYAKTAQCRWREKGRSSCHA